MARTANATYPMKITCLIGIKAAEGNPFICPECGRPILPHHAIQFDHRHAVGRGGANNPDDLAPVHAAKRGTVDSQGHPLDCHDRKTFRPLGGATTLGGDNYEAKKTVRLAAMTKQDHAVLHGQAVRAAGRLRSKPFQSRANAWPPRGSRPMNRKRRA